MFNGHVSANCTISVLLGIFPYDFKLFPSTSVYFIFASITSAIPSLKKKTFSLYVCMPTYLKYTSIFLTNHRKFPLMDNAGMCTLEKQHCSQTLRLQIPAE